MTKAQSRKVILITGSSQGIGAGIAQFFGEKEYTVVVTYFADIKAADSVCASVKRGGGEAVSVQVDVKSEASVKRLFKLVSQKYGRLDVLVNNAAIDYPAPLESCLFSDWQIITRTKIDGNFLCTKYALHLLKESPNANLVIITSSLGDRPDPEDPAYCVGTAATICFMKAMALYLAKYGIRTNAVSPGETRTKMWKNFGDSDELWEKFAKSNPLGKTCTPEYVAQTVWAIVNDKTNFLNGNIIYVNGGGHLK